MKTFRLIGIFLIAVLVSFSLASCGDDNDDTYNDSESIQSTSLLVGTWKVTTKEYTTDLGLTAYIQLTSDGKYYEVDIDEDEGVDILYGEWTVEDDKIIVTGGNTIGYYEVQIVELSETSLTVNFLLFTATYEKVDDSVIAPYLSGLDDGTTDGEATDEETVDGSADVVYTYDENGEATVKSVQDESLSGAIVIPSYVTYNGVSYKVTGVGDFAFACTNVTSVTFPSTITELPSYCFWQCYNLTSVTLPSSINKLGSGCFDDCTSLKSITLPGSITTLGTYCFYNCTSLKSITLPSSITSLGSFCFYNCSSLTSIDLSNTSITKLREDCFNRCSSLTSVTLREGITSIESDCFYGCISLTSITLPSSITSLESLCFDACTKLTSVTCKWATSSELSGVTVDSKAFGYYFDVASNCTLYVPSGTKSIYEAKSPWKDFKSIVEK